MPQAELKTVKDLILSLKTNTETGLSDEEAQGRLSSYGRNQLLQEKTRKLWLSFFAFLKEPMIWLLVGTAVIYFVLGDSFDAWIMVSASVPIAAIDVIIDYKTESALDKLRQKASPRVKVIRNGRELDIDSADLVPGDLFIVTEGDVIPADAVALEASDARVDESALTGESLLVDKESSADYSEDVFGNKGFVFAGTTLMGGKARCIAYRTGSSTQYGEIGKMLSSIETAQTPLQRNMEKVVKVLGILAIALSAFLFIVQMLVAHKVWSSALLDALSLAIAAIPEEFPVTFVLFLSLGAWVLARSNALVKRMVSVETLGSVNVICTDKTGTLTTGRMALAKFYCNGQVHDAEKFLSHPNTKHILEAATLASEKNPFDPIERAIFECVAKSEDPEKVQERSTLEVEYEFDHKSKLMSHIWRTGGNLAIYAKGSIEGILERCSISKQERAEVLGVNERLARKGMRILALSSKKLFRSEGRAKDEWGMQFLALLVFSDPVREGVPEAVRDCETAGIRVVMLTGDHKHTAQAIGESIGLKGASPVEGRDITEANSAQLASLISSANIFSRVTPEQKLGIVTAFQNQGNTVAVTGDGINDAPALKKADIGIAMGQRGTEVARETASMVLLDDHFVTIVKAIRQGRIIYDNLKKVFNYLIAFHVPIFLSAFVIPLLGLPLLLMPIHIIFLELFLHPVISIVFQQQPGEKDIMLRKPRSRNAPLVNRKSLARLIFIGALLFAISLAAYWSDMNGGELHARSSAFTILIFGEVFIMVTELSGSMPSTLSRIFSNKALVFTVLFTVLGWSLLGSLELTHDVFKITRLTPVEILVSLGLALIPLAASEIWKRIQTPTS